VTLKRTFHIKSPAGPFEDPFLYLRFFHTGRAILFDLGDLLPLTPRDLLRITDIFVSHTHMDHFTGFERLLRTHLHRTRILRIFGPESFLERIDGKLKGYTWNLTKGYPLSILAVEAGEGVIKTAVFRAENGFKREDLETGQWDGIIHEESGFRIRAAVLDHGIPCLGFRIEQKMHVQILSGELKRRGLVPGPWLSSLKSNIMIGDPPSKRIRMRTSDGMAESTLGEMEGIYRTAPGAVLAYVVDVADSSRNIDRIVALAQNADLLYIEAAFTSEDVSLAIERNHLTAGRVGRIASMASVVRTKLIHLSPRYEGREDELIREARAAAEPEIRIEGGWRDWA
jgi:ribonuclease Z